MDVRIKHRMKDSKCADKLLAEYPCFMVIETGHDHRLGTADDLKRLPTSDATKQKIEEYYT